MQSGKTREALPYLAKALNFQETAQARATLAWAQWQLGEHNKAMRNLALATQAEDGNDPFVDWVYLAMGEVFLRLGEYHRADIALSTSVYHNNRIASRWSRLGFAREQLGDWQFALEAYERALQLDPALGDAVRGRDRVNAALRG